MGNTQVALFCAVLLLQFIFLCYTQQALFFYFLFMLNSNEIPSTTSGANPEPSNLVPNENPAALHVIVSVFSSERLDAPAIHPARMLGAWVTSYKGV